MANSGVIPDDTTREASRAALQNRTPAPEAAEPMPKCVIVFEPPVAAGKETAAALLTLAADTVHPAPERATATRA